MNNNLFLPMPSIRWILLLMAMLWNSGAFAVPPQPFLIGGTIMVDGVQLTQSTDTGLVVRVTRADGSDFTGLNGNSPEDSDGLNASDFYTIKIPIYDATDQPNGAQVGESAMLHVAISGADRSVDAPSGGLFSIGDTGTSRQINVQASQAVPVVSVTPTSLNFGNQLVGSTSTPSVVTLSNTGNAALSIIGISANGDYTQTHNCGATVAAGGSCVINVLFTPTTAGVHNGNLTIQSNAASSPDTVALQGSGNQLPLAPSTVTASDGSYTDKVNITWSPVSAAISYKLFRCTTTSTDSCTQEASPTGTSYDDTSATPGTTYYYRVKATNSAGDDSDYSDYDAGSISIVPCDGDTVVLENTTYLADDEKHCTATIKILFGPNITENSGAKLFLTTPEVKFFPPVAIAHGAILSVIPLYDWYTSVWGECTGACGIGNATQTRTVYCEDSSGVIVSDNYCAGSKPVSNQSCTTCVTGEDTGYLSHSEYQDKFDYYVENNYFPSVVEGKLTIEGNEFRGLFEPYPSGDFNFESHHGMDEVEYFSNSLILESFSDYQLLWKQSFTDSLGDLKYQATWVRGGNAVFDCINQNKFWYEQSCHTTKYPGTGIFDEYERVSLLREGF